VPENLSKVRAFQKVLVVGAGALGGYFGGCLARTGAQVAFLLRPKTREQLSRQGLRIKSINGDFALRPLLVAEPEEAPLPELILLSTKCYDVAPVLPKLAPLIDRGSLILTLQNGVRTEEEIRDYYQKDCVLAGVAFITAKCPEPGVIEHRRGGILSLGELSGEKTERLRKAHALLSASGIECRLRSRILCAKWEKLCWNATFNPLSVILGHPIRLILETPSLLEVVRHGIAEVVAVAAAEGYPLNPNIIENTISASFDLGDFYTSMYEDFKHGKPSEIEYLNGEVLRRGRKRGIKTPIQHMLYGLVKALEKRGLAQAQRH